MYFLRTLVENFVTEKDDRIRASQIPERLYERFEGDSAPVYNEEEAILQAQWVINTLPIFTSAYWNDYDELEKKDMMDSIVGLQKLILEEVSLWRPLVWRPPPFFRLNLILTIPFVVHSLCRRTRFRLSGTTAPMS